MAVAINSFDLGYGFNNLHHSFSKKNHLIRCYGGDFSVGSSKMPWRFCCSTQKLIFTVQRRDLQLNKKPQFGEVLSALCSNDGGDIYEEQKEDEISRVTLIWRAVKLPIYSVAFIPLTVGCAAAYLQTGVFLATRYFVLLASSILIITWLNLSNDVYDFDTGADKNKKESVVNLVGSRSGTLVAAYSLLALGFTGLTWASSAASSVQALLLLASAIFCGYIYQCPPFRLSYQGLGEPLCFSAFGPFATTAFYLLLGSPSEVINPPLTGTILSASALVGLTTSLILFCSHFHQIEEDKAVGKISPLVRLGTEGGSHAVKATITILYSILLFFGLIQTLPLTCILLCAITVPMGKLVVDYVDENHKNKGKIFMAKYYCVRLHALFGTALAGGLVAARMLTGR